MDPSSHPRSFTTRAQAAFKSGGGKRLLAAVAVAILALVGLVLLGPDENEIKKRFEYYGAPDELRIMPEISIEDGSDAIHQLPQSLQAPPPPAEVEIEPEDLSPDATEPTPERADESRESDPSETYAEGETSERTQVELALPRQSNPDWFILHQVRPEYPLGISDFERRQPVIVVRAAVFVGPDGQVQEAMITNTTGSEVFGQAVLEAIGQWVFGWRVDPGAGRWIEMTWNFRSPYYER
ncbi:MAG: hypothetical protein GY838_08590 [bacterium]|nr:hypothetical protein [bacterium]